MTRPVHHAALAVLFAAGPLQAAAVLPPSLGALAADAPALSAPAAEATVSRGPANFNDPDKLLDLSRNPDAGVRRAALRSLRYYLGQWRVKDRLEEVLNDSRETLEVRKEAAKSLGSGLLNNQANDKLMDIAKGWRREDPALRLVCIKALYRAAGSDYRARDLLRDLARGWSERDTQVRAAAVWGLFLASQNDYNVRSSLMDILGSSSEDLGLRVEALKSLYLAMGDYSVQSKITDLARDRHADMRLRYGAVLALSARLNDYGTRSILDDLSRSADDPALRQAAIIAMGGPNSPEIYTYFHTGCLDPLSGAVIDPLDAVH